MATSRSFGGMSFTTRSPIRSSPAETDSRPAIMRSVVVLPHPEGPTSTRNSPSAMSRSMPWTATGTRPPSSYIFRTPCSDTLAMNSSAPMNDAVAPASRFPAGFLWGAATSAYQIEGSPLADGAGPSIWHRFAHTPGRTTHGETGDVAADHYHRWAEDVQLMRELGLGAYRFSISWSRILPLGTGQVNRAGLAFYDRLVDALLAAGIQPMATLYHWDLPAALDDRGGWLNPDIAEWFAEYTTVVTRALDDRVAMWTTLNEPWVVADGGYLFGALAPGHRNIFEAPIASHNLLRAHGRAVQAYRAAGHHDIGLVVNLEPKYAASDTPEDLAAAERANAYMNRYYLDPAFLGRYPDELHEVFGEAWRDSSASDMELIR